MAANLLPENESFTESPSQSNDALEALSRLKRPGLLVRAARIGLNDYDRGRGLRRIFRGNAPGTAVLIDNLLAQEAAMNADRTNRRASYDTARHVEILIALMAEARDAERQKAAAARAVPCPHPPSPFAGPAQPNASGIDALRVAT